MRKEDTSKGVTDREIEITPEMVEAGLEALMDFEEDYICSEEAAIRVYRAMAAASQ